MEISILEVVGPVMIGPSSSHTAGACRLAKTASRIVGKPFHKVVFGLGGSFASTYKGHFTDHALVGGVLGMDADDENICRSLDIAEEQGLEYSFVETEIQSRFENNARITFFLDNGCEYYIEGASVGGGGILITNINGFELEITASCPTLVIRQRDVKGVISEVSTILTNYGINIGVMKVSRTERGTDACTVIECDEAIPLAVVEELRCAKDVISVAVVGNTEAV